MDDILTFIDMDLYNTKEQKNVEVIKPILL